MKRILFVTAVLGLFTLALCAADVSGAWLAQIPGRGGQTAESTITLKVDGDKLTGSIAGPRGERPIEEGKISGDDLSFTQTLEFGGNRIKLLYKGKVSGNEIKFTRQRDGGDGQAQEFTAKRK
jgi:hypothetical protein